MLHHIASKSATNREAMSDLVSVACFTLKQEFAPLPSEKLSVQKAVARSGFIPCRVCALICAGGVLADPLRSIQRDRGGGCVH